jgi:hypothetical protein
LFQQMRQRHEAGEREEEMERLGIPMGVDRPPTEFDW